MSANPIPWSAVRELKLRRKIVSIWAGVWICMLAGLLVAIYSEVAKQPVFLMAVAVLWAVGIFLICDLSAARAELGEEMCRLPGGGFHEGSGMLANKPRQTANLTKWIQHRATESAFYCECAGRRYGGEVAIHLEPHTWADAQWIPNYDMGFDTEVSPGDLLPEIDPGGGRYVILCPCGLGHYKLKS